MQGCGWNLAGDILCSALLGIADQPWSVWGG